MKKISILALSFATVMGASAQIKDQLKTVEKAFGDVKDYPAFVETVKTVIVPLEATPEIASASQTWVIPGKAAFKIYDDMYANAALGKEVDKVQLAQALIDGYNYYDKALSLQPAVNEKGKVEPKFSEKDIINTVKGHYSDFNNAGSSAWEARDYADAYKAWGIYAALPGDSRFGIVAPADTTVSYAQYLQGLAAWQADMLPQAIECFDKSINAGYVNPDILQYATQVALQSDNHEKMFEYAKKGLDKYGTNNSTFLLLTLNGYIESKQFEQAQTLLADLIAKEPNNPVLYYSSGVLEDNIGNYDKAIDALKKATQLNDKYDVAFLTLGKVIAEKYDKLDGDADPNNQQAYAKLKAETLQPLLKEAAAAFEAAYKLDNENEESLRYLRNIYYNLNDETNLNRIDQLLKAM